MVVWKRGDGNQKATGNARMVSNREEVAGWFLSLEMELPTRVCVGGPSILQSCLGFGSPRSPVGSRLLGLGGRHGWTT